MKRSLNTSLVLVMIAFVLISCLALLVSTPFLGRTIVLSQMAIPTTF